MSHWTSKHAISRDLSAAQGLVPVAIHRIVGADDKPPALDIKEDTEEEFFRHCTGEGDCNVAPDLGLIKQMLEIVRDKESTSDEDIVEDITMITKLKAAPDTIMPLSNISENHDAAIVTSSKKPNSKKKIRNVALESILKAIEDNNAQANIDKPVDTTPKLLKPNDFISDDPEIVESVEKVNGWLDSQIEMLSPTVSPNQANPVALEPINMFKKKVPIKKGIKIDETKAPVINNNNGEVYRPSELAEVYYNNYVERVKLKEATQMDIWAKAEQKMKEIDARRALEAAQAQGGGAPDVAKPQSN